MNKVRQFISQPVVLDAGVSVVGSTLAAIFSGIALLLFSRALGPQEFGLISVGFSLMLIIAKITEGGLNSVLIKYLPTAENDDTQAQLFWYTLGIKAMLGVVVAGILTVLAPLLSQSFHVPVALILVVAWFNLITLAYDHLVAVLTALLKIQKAVFGNILQALIKVGIGVVVFLTASFTGVLAFLLYMLAPAPVIFYFKGKIPAPILHKPADIHWKTYWNTTKAMSINNWIAGLSSAVVQNSDIFVVTIFMPGLAVGYMGAAMRLTMFIALMGYSLGGVLYPRVAKLSSAHQVSTYWLQATLLLGVSLIGAFVLPYFANVLILLSAGGDYLGAVPVMRWLLAASCIGIGTVGFGALFFRYHQPSYFSIIAIVQSVIIVAGTITLIPSYGLVSVGWVRLCSQLLVLGITVVWAVWAHFQTFRTWPWSTRG